MRRADRLMDLIRHLREGELHRATDLARVMGVSLRTIYRDMETLAASGVPIEGERGTGYRVTAAITLPPLNLSMAELEALHVSLAAMTQAQDADLAAAATSLARKLDGVLPEGEAPRALAVYPFADAARGFQHLPKIRSAIRARQKLMLTTHRDRTVRPLQLDYWGRLWTCIVWCDTTRKFDELRIDQITALRVLPSLFVEEEGKRLSDFRRQRDRDWAREDETAVAPDHQP
ncbi:helix-turn-helix transcriptional regulator [Pseudooctadecabacter jejudonensis]|uniref:Bifunctional biotin--[acetyl-CoA-carboxylase] synthetase/biotin operon repressor n=1 Tax=Pseudooctadecabacter jejudonensis TaxID=1391910 RepID=A0A1Y5TC69_9RHOB|nr:HTH domain-containing protein [Pseudooctadecabacter jejudonensis]SLN58558.1 bifunctional biotin--[acetyl-CoA-carboxylase] synthetase/biotin operon repressor [Pseudooctadecabacter jejudonensis]